MPPVQRGMRGLLERLKHVRALGLPRDLGEGHPSGPAREICTRGDGRAAEPAQRLRRAAQDCDPGRAQISELETTLTDAAIALFESLTAQLFTRSTRDSAGPIPGRPARRRPGASSGCSAVPSTPSCRPASRTGVRSTSSTRRLAGTGWWRRATRSSRWASWRRRIRCRWQAGRYTQLRRFGPAFLEVFAFDAPVAGRSLQTAVELLRELNRSGRRKLPDIVPMPFASRQWRALVVRNAKSARRTYETAVVATLRDRLRAGDVWVEGSRDYRRFDAYLPSLPTCPRHRRPVELV